MILNDFVKPRPKFSNHKLDAVLAELCGLVLAGQRDDPELNGRVGAAVLDPQGRLVTGVGYQHGSESVHGEYSAIENYENEYGELPKGCIIITTLSPCNESHDKTADERHGPSCTDLLNSKGIKMAYCGYDDYTQDGDQAKFDVVITSNSKIKQLCKKIADTFLKDLQENFADGRVKGKSRPGRVKKSGASCNGSVTDLRRKAKKYSGEKGKMYQWCLNMKAGKK